MLYSRSFIPTLKDDPSDAELASHKLMIRAGMIRKLAAGIYNLLPLGLEVLRKVENIVREEMNRAGAIELSMPAVQPRELWEETGRWNVMGKELLRIKDRHERDFCFGPTHEEVITDIVRREVRSYRQLPLNLYQIQTKFRDEIRPRFGLMRAREFVMKDGYSFDADEEAAERSYKLMYDAYCRIFSRCGLTYSAVEADTGAIGGKFSHEFMVLAESGEDVVLSCEKCGYAANAELAEIRSPERVPPDPAPSEMEEFRRVETPGMTTVESVTGFLGVKPERLIKTIIMTADSKPVAVLARGDHEVNPVKVRNALGARIVEMADAETVREVTNAPVGFAGPHGLKVQIIADHAVRGMKNAVTGANAADAHVMGSNAGRDYKVDFYSDIRTATEGDPCPKCGAPFKKYRGIEVGHIFMLGTKYSEAMGACFLDREGKERPFIMGCFGIGIGRTAAAAIEQNHDERGIIWPKALAPVHVYILTVNAKREDLAQAAQKIHDDLEGAGYKALFDDRDERAGVKFADADLLGAPLRITVGPKHIGEGKVELKERGAGEIELVDLSGIVSRVNAYYAGDK